MHVLRCKVCAGLATLCPGELGGPQEAKQGCGKGCPEHDLVVGQQDGVMAECSLQPEEYCWDDWLSSTLGLLPALPPEALQGQAHQVKVLEGVCESMLNAQHANPGEVDSCCLPCDGCGSRS